MHKPSVKDSRLIILHAGGEEGWIEGAELVFQSKKSTGDYHDEMNAERFEEWFRDTLIPNFSSLIGSPRALSATRPHPSCHKSRKALLAYIKWFKVLCPGGVRQDHVHYITADVGTSFLNQNTLRLSRSATSLGDNLTGKFVAKWIPLPKSFRLSYLTPPLPLLVFALSMDEGVASSCASSSSRERQRYQGMLLRLLNTQTL